MKQATPKQLEIREREARILDLTQTMLVEVGSVDITMDRVADAIGVSKGTVYQHFSSKEDLLAAVAVRSSSIRGELFERAATFRGSSRERMGAIGVAAELFFTLYPHHEQAERAFKASSASDKISEERRSGMQSGVFRCFGAATGIIRDAVSAGDLELRPGQSIEQVCIGLWNLYIGAFLMKDLEQFIDEPAINNPIPMLFDNAQVLLDGFGWRALSTDHDYLAARRRAMEEVFEQEARSASLL